MPRTPRAAGTRRAPRRVPLRARAARPAPVLDPEVVTVPPSARTGLAEPPHSHIVCRECGRITRLELREEERQLLVALAAQHPAGWTVDGIAFSLTGRCARCRDGVRP